MVCGVCGNGSTPNGGIGMYSGKSIGRDVPIVLNNCVCVCVCDANVEPHSLSGPARRGI